MANPEVAVAFQNPKIQTAIMDVSFWAIFFGTGKFGFMPLGSLFLWKNAVVCMWDLDPIIAIIVNDIFLNCKCCSDLSSYP
jgi:hypothetical protein